jgi:ribonuclease HIII
MPVVPYGLKKEQAIANVRGLLARYGNFSETWLNKGVILRFSGFDNDKSAIDLNFSNKGIATCISLSNVPEAKRQLVIDHAKEVQAGKLAESKAKDTPAGKLAKSKEKDAPAGKLAKSKAKDAPASKLAKNSAKEAQPSKLAKSKAKDAPASKLAESKAKDAPAGKLAKNSAKEAQPAKLAIIFSQTRSVPYGLEKTQAIENIRGLLAGYGKFAETKLNKGAGLRFSVLKYVKSAIDLHFSKSGIARSISLSNVPEAIYDFVKTHAIDARASTSENNTFSGPKPGLASGAEAKPELSEQASAGAGIKRPPVPRQDLSGQAIAKPGLLEATETAGHPFPGYENLYLESVGQIGEGAYQFLEPKERLTLCGAMGQLILARESKLRLPCYNVLLLPFAKVFEGFVTKLIMVKLKIDPIKYQKDPRHFPVGKYLSVAFLGEFIVGQEPNHEIISRLALLWAGFRSLDVGVYHNGDLGLVGDFGSVEKRVGQIVSAIGDAFLAFRLKFALGFADQATAPFSRDILAVSVPLEGIGANKHANNNSGSIDKLSKSIINPQQPTVRPLVHYAVRIGTDESGKGDYFGPLVIAGVFLNPDLENKISNIGVNDSKMNTDAQNIMLADIIKTSLGKKHYYILQISPEKYNQLYAKHNNPNHILAWGHAKVLENLLTRVECSHAIVDQFDFEETIIQALGGKGKNIEIFQTAMAERDMAVAAASILARESFLSGLNELGQKFGVRLLKGTSSFVDAQIREIHDTLGPGALATVGKTHFRSTKKAGVILA